MQQSLIELIAEAQAILDKIAAHDDFAKLLETEAWDDPAITLNDASQALEDLQKAHENSVTVVWEEIKEPSKLQELTK